MDPSITSTPQAKGTAPYAEFNMDHHAGSPRNIQRVETDLEKSTQSVHILPLLKAFLAEVLLECKNTDTKDDPEFLKGVLKESNKLFSQMLRDAIDFCNDQKNKNRAKLMKNLDDYANQPYEKQRYQPFASALNTILSEFQDKTYGPIPKPSTRPNKENLIFMPNDPHSIESTHLRNDCPQSIRKPDIVAVHTSYLCKVDDTLKKETFNKVAKLISENAITANPENPLEWTNVHQPWEFKVKDRHLEKPPRIKWAVRKLLRDLYEKDTEVSRKRTRDADASQANENPTSRAKSSRKSLYTSVHTSILPEESSNVRKPPTGVPTLPTRTQCAYYGIERSSSVWHATYGSVVLVEDTKLSVRRFDAQSCIESEDFDIFQSLPLFVVMIAIFQRFSLHTWGLTEKDAMKVKVDNKSFRLAPTETPFQLNGRRTTGTSAIYDDNAPDDDVSSSESSTSSRGNDERHSTTDALRGNPDEWENGMPLFFKSYWVECARNPEHHFIFETHKRANTILPERYRRMVTDHIPTVIAAQVCKNDTTARFRLFLRFAGAFPHLNVEYIQAHARVRVWIVMPRLRAIHKLEPSQFMKVLWDSIRCHYLMWRSGIAHGDISLTNLMYRIVDSELVGMLNDFDLAAIMEPGARSPPKIGWERTGTLPFLALDLLRYHSGEIGRRYRHDLESFSWCLLWEMLIEPSSTWTEGTLKEVLDSRHSVMSAIGEQTVFVRPAWSRDFKIVANWFRSWHNYNAAIDLEISDKDSSIDSVITIPEVVAIRNKKDDDTDDTVHIKAAVAAVKNARGSNILGIPALVDTTWIDVVLEPTAS